MAEPSEGGTPAKRTIDFNITQTGDDFEDKIRSISANREKKPVSKKSAMIRDSYLSTREMVMQRNSLDSMSRRQVGSTSDDDFVSTVRTSNRPAVVAIPSRVSRMIMERERKEMQSKSMHAGDSDSDSRDGDRTIRSLPATTNGTKNKYFHSMTEEVLFKAMKNIRPQTTSNTRRSSAGDIRLTSKNINQHLGSQPSMASTKTATTAATALKKKHFGVNHNASLQRLTSDVKKTSQNTAGGGRNSKYALDDEKKNCTFKPRLNMRRRDTGRDKGRDDSSDDEAESKTKAAASGAFFDRQAADERRRRTAIETARGKAAYDALVDKKFCPNCGGKRSYDEYKEKKKKCQKCMVDYVNKVVWNSRMSKEFFKRDVDFRQAKQKHVEELKTEVIDHLQQYPVQTYDPETRKVVQVNENQFKKNLRWNADMEEEFLERLEECNNKKEERFSKIKEEMSYTFAPTISSKAPMKKKGDDEDDENQDDTEGNDGKPKNTVKIFLARMERDMEEYRKVHPVVPKKVKPKASQPRFFV